MIGKSTALLAAVLLVAPVAAAQSNNAAPAYRQAFTLLGSGGFGGSADPLMSREDRDFISELGPMMTPEQRARAEGILQKVQPAFDLLMEGSRQRKCDWELDRSKGFDLMLPHLSAMRDAARLIRAKSYMASSDVDRAAVIEAVGAMGRMSAHSGQDAVLISSLVGSAIGTLTTESATLAIEAGAIDEKNATQMIEALSTLKNGDPYRYSEAVRGEYGMLASSFKGADSPERVQQMLKEFGASPELMQDLTTPEQLSNALRQSKGLYDRVAGAFDMADPEAARRELKQIENMVEGGRGGPLAKLLMPSFTKLYESKVRSQQEIMALLARLQAIADGKLERKEFVNAALLLARAAAAANSMADDAQDVIEMARVAPDAMDAAARERAKAALERVDATVLAPLAEAALLARCDFKVLRHPTPSLDARLHGGLRGAARVALANGLRLARAQNSASAAVPSLIVAFRAAALMSTDPTLARAHVAQSIWTEATEALKQTLAIGPLSKDERNAVEQAMATMGAGDPFGWRKALESDVSDTVKWHLGWRSAAANAEADELRTKILKQRGATATLSRIALMSAVRNESGEYPDAKAPTLVRLTDLWPAETLETFQKAAAAARDKVNQVGEAAAPIVGLGVFDVPYDLPIDEQKDQYRKLDPVKGMTLADAAALQAQAPVVFVKPFDLLK